MSDRDPYTDGSAERGWSARSVAAAAVAMILVIAAISYAINNNSTSTASGPSAAGAGSSTVGEATRTSSGPATPSVPSGTGGSPRSHGFCTVAPDSNANYVPRDTGHVAHGASAH